MITASKINKPRNNILDKLNIFIILIVLIKLPNLLKFYHILLNLNVFFFKKFLI